MDKSRESPFQRSYPKAEPLAVERTLDSIYTGDVKSHQSNMSTYVGISFDTTRVPHKNDIAMSP